MKKIFVLFLMLILVACSEEINTPDIKPEKKIEKTIAAIDNDSIITTEIVGGYTRLRINSDFTYFASRAAGSLANVQIFASQSSTGTTGVWLEGYGADRQAYLTLNSMSGDGLLGQLVMRDNADANSTAINFYKTYLQFSDGLLLGGDKFSINQSGQITKVNGIESKEGYVLAGGENGYSPKRLAMWRGELFAPPENPGSGDEYYDRNTKKILKFIQSENRWIER